MKIKPVDERVLIKPVEEEERQVRKQKKLSDVIKVGDRVIYARYGGTEVKIEGDEFLIVSRSDILGIVQK